MRSQLLCVTAFLISIGSEGPFATLASGRDGDQWVHVVAHMKAAA